MSKKFINIKKNRKLSETVKKKLNSMIGKSNTAKDTKQESRITSPLKQFRSPLNKGNNQGSTQSLASRELEDPMSPPSLKSPKEQPKDRSEMGEYDTTYAGSDANTTKYKHINKIKSSILLPNNKLYRAIITMPRIEYAIESSDFSIVKVLNINEL